mgnify:CR=1 FL=1
MKKTIKILVDSHPLGKRGEIVIASQLDAKVAINSGFAEPSNGIAKKKDADSK